jgi:hypothetical protein
MGRDSFHGRIRTQRDVPTHTLFSTAELGSITNEANRTDSLNRWYRSDFAVALEYRALV